MALCQSWDLNSRPHVILICIPQETLSERLQRKATVSTSTFVKRLSLYLLAWTLCVGLAVASCTAIYFLQSHQSKLVRFYTYFTFTSPLKNTISVCDKYIFYRGRSLININI